MKRKWALVLAALLCFCAVLSGCANTVVKPGRVQIVCTIFPEYDWVRQIVGDTEGVDVTLLIQNGTDLHSYQPSVYDIAQIAEADLFFYVGGISDSWVTDVLETAENETAKTVALLEVTDADEEVIVEGMQEEEHHHDHSAEEEHEEARDHEEETAELDEHVWLSLRRAKMACGAIRDILCEADPDYALQYQENCDSYLKQLDELDMRYQKMLEEDAVRTTILVADRFPFRYLADDYGLTYYAAFPGCSAETEASFETIVFLSQKAEELELPCVLTLENSDQSLARTVLENTRRDSGEILAMDSLQSVTQKDLEQGVTYLSRMEENLGVLRTALSAT